MTALKIAKDFRNNPYLFLMLGPACNMVCRHCSQNPYKGTFIKDNVSDEVKELIGSYIEYYQAQPERKRPAMILFWGGEALIHWFTIKEIIDEFTDKYDMRHNNQVVFCIASNGLLLTDEMVEYFNENNVQFNFSFDAPYPYAVRGKVPEETIERIKKLKHLVVLSSLNAINCDAFAVLSCMRRKFGGYAIRMFFNFQLLYTSDFSKDIVDFDFDKVRKGLRMCRIAFQMGDRYFGQLFYTLLKIKRHPEEKAFTFNTGLRYCVPGHRYLTVMLDGKVVRCHNDARIQIGTVNDSLDEISQKGLEICSKLQGDKQIAKCKECEHFDICPGGCMMGIRNPDGTYKACDLYIKQIYQILKEEAMWLSTPLSEEDKKWYNENLPVYIKQSIDYSNGIYG